MRLLALRNAAGETDAVRVLLYRWDNLNGVVEWLAKRLDLPMVQLGYNSRPIPSGLPCWRLRDWGPWSLRRSHLRSIPSATINECSLRHARQ
jgi:hypothetical protein